MLQYRENVGVGLCQRVVDCIRQDGHVRSTNVGTVQAEVFTESPVVQQPTEQQQWLILGASIPEMEHLPVAEIQPKDWCPQATLQYAIERHRCRARQIENRNDRMD